MRKASRALLLGTSLALGAGALPAPAVHAQVRLKDAEPRPQVAPQPQPQLQPQQPPTSPQQPAQGPQQQPTQPQQQAAQPPQPQLPDLQQAWQMQKMQMRARIAGAVQQLRAACGNELRNFCGTVTPGEGRLLLCMQAHEDQLSRPCELALLETARNVGKAIRRLEDFAQACWQDIQVHCSGAAGGSVIQCMIENHSALSGPCKAMVAAAAPSGWRTRHGQTMPQDAPAQGQAQQGQPTMIGLPIFSADGMMLGQVTGLRRRNDGSLEAIEAELGSPLGLGSTSVLITPDELHWRGDGVELRNMMADQVRSVLQGQRR